MCQEISPNKKNIPPSKFNEIHTFETNFQGVPNLSSLTKMSKINIIVSEETECGCDIYPAATDNEIIHVLLKKLYMSDTEEDLFGSPEGFWNDAKIKHLVHLMTVENDLARITANRDYERIYLKISRKGIDISKKGGWLNHLKQMAVYE